MRAQLAAREAREAWPSGMTGLPDPCCVPEEHRAWPPWGSRQSGSGLAGRATIISLSSGFLGAGGRAIAWEANNYVAISWFVLPRHRGPRAGAQGHR